jgi:histidine phosphotransferase ChpT
MNKHPLNAQVIARICHDLISPIGAIGNGVELLLESNGPSPELDLIAQSADTARHKVNFFRVAFDGPRPGAMLSGSEFSQVLCDMFANARMQVSVINAPAHLSRDAARLLMLLTLCVENVLPLGGQLALEHGNGDWVFNGHGRRVEVDPSLWNHLTDGEPLPEQSAARVHFPLARQALEGQGQQLKFLAEEPNFVLRLA